MSTETIEPLAESPVSRCIRFMESIEPKIRMMAKFEESTPQRERKALCKTDAIHRRVQVLERIKAGMSGAKACRLSGMHSTMFRKCWFPDGICRHEGFEGMKWRK